MNKIEFCFDFGSPTAYLAWDILSRMAQRPDIEIVWHPMLLGGVFKATGNVSPVSIPAKGTYMFCLPGSTGATATVVVSLRAP